MESACAQGQSDRHAAAVYAGGQLVYCDDFGAELRALTPAIVSRRVQGPFLGYLQAQQQRLTGERGQKRIHRPELEEMYEFDTKYAMHMLRLGFQGVELLTTGR